MKAHRKIYGAVISELESGNKSREELISGVMAEMGECYDGSVGCSTELRARIGEVINEMADMGVISLSGNRYLLTATRSYALRAENCEREIIALLTDGPKTKDAIRRSLEKIFGTEKTPTLRDDQTLHSLIGQVLKRLTALGVITFYDNRYEISPDRTARLDDINEILTLKADFINRLHSKGGEFFEHYIMSLLAKFLSKHGKTVTENRTLGGANDGGIDGIIKTTDPLGFRETIMVQAKNRIDITNETTVRGFYGAVCAAQGSRGIFATTSDFHSSAEAFLAGIDNCVGVNGEDIFRMAIECQWGIKRHKGRYYIDTKLL